ncbi:Hypothetical predicted protein [Lecanosticta acicola]|uniref:NAD-dependent epimerase/dehydratase domain-containing protein n=1 Tax=Lecanosticta acicola TaxID=111012 RepID=A0AAI9ED94_9PEZI|nr:Hypothetical predicted protein [Lecanosticta acicola]
MAPRIFITGGTGYIGGTVLDTLVKKHPEYELSALLRNPPSNFPQLYPSVTVVRGDYDNFDILSEAASKADIVIHNGNSDHEPSIKALIDGLLKSSKSGFLIHLSGTGILADWRSPEYLGKKNPKVWSDIDDIEEITSRPDAELHRNVDKIIQEAARKHGERLKTAIVCPPDIYGKGRGPGRTTSVYFPVFLDEIKTIGAPFFGGEGANTRSWVHIDDLMQIYLKLVEAAAGGGGSADWGVEGYYFASMQEYSQLEIARKTGEILAKHGLLEKEKAAPLQVSLERIDQTMQSYGFPHIGTYMFAANSRTWAHRAPKKLGYQPGAPKLWDQLEADLLDAAGKR